MKPEIRSSHDTFRNSGEIWSRPFYHRAVSRQQSDDPSGVESTQPERSGCLHIDPAGRAFRNHWRRGPLSGHSGLKRNISRLARRNKKRQERFAKTRSLPSTQRLASGVLGGKRSGGSDAQEDRPIGTLVQRGTLTSLVSPRLWRRQCYRIS